MKLTSEQLKKIILEEVKKTMTTVKKQSFLNESFEGLGSGGAAFQTGVDECRNEWMGMYDENDPVMNAGGQEGWEKQVEIACEELTQKIIDAHSEVEYSLLDGDYADDR